VPSVERVDDGVEQLQERVDGITGLIAASLRLHPDDIPAAAAAQGLKEGLEDLTILLADLEQRVLVPLVGDSQGTSDPADHLSIDGTIAGRAYRTESPIVSDTVDGRRSVWLPLLDSAERLGVVSATTTREVDDVLLGRFTNYCSVVGELVANKSGYGDVVIRTRRTRPISLSAELRWSMLPPLTYSGRNLTISGVLEPAYDIAGDTFDYAVNDDSAHVAIIDAVGHGLEASRIANLAVAAYRNGRRSGLGVGGIYRLMDAAIVDQFGNEKFATAQLANLTLSTGQMCWLNAGHPAPMIIRQGHRLDLSSEIHLPVGLAMDDTEPELSALDLQPGDLVLFFTDGVIEARSSDGEEFGRDRLGDLLERAVAAGQTPAETLRRLAQAVLEHQEGVLQDDGTLLVLVWHGPPAVLAATAPGTHAATSAALD